MDGLSVAASIAGLVSLADTVFARTYRYAKTVKHAAKDIDQLATSIRDLSSLLHGLNLVLHELEDQADRSNLSNLAEFRLYQISSCLSTLTKIQKKLDKHQPNVASEQSVKQALRSLKWPFSVTDTKELLTEVEKHKAAINISLSGETLTTILKTLSKQDGLTADLKDLKDKQSERWAMEDHIRLNEDRKEILAFFSKIDPSSNHILNLKLRHPLTGLWVTEGVSFRKWLSTRNSKLWLSGIPGAGKTVIAASVIEETMRKSSKDHAVAYFYCDYKDLEKQIPLNVLSSLLSQLARQNENSLVGTSHLERDYTHIEIAAQGEDLRLYVAAEMETRQKKHGREKLKIKSNSLKQHMMKTLVERADGMFRWVTCQLDFLCSLPTDAEKRKALGSLPPGLNSTYERILERVNQNDESIQRMVQNSLQWIVNAVYSIPTIALCHAISIKDGDKAIDQEAIYDEEDILMHCSSLIRRSAHGKSLEMAHFTVKEFLSALTPDARSPYSRYSQSKAFVFPQLAITCLTYITLDQFCGNFTDNPYFWGATHEDEYPLRRHAVEHWVYYAHDNWENTRVLALAKTLFDFSTTTCFLSWARDFLYFQYTTDRWCIFEEKFTIPTRKFCLGGLKPLHMAAALGLVEICRWLIISGSSVDERSDVGTPLHCVLFGGRWLSHILLNEGWFPFWVEFYPIQNYEGRTQIIKLFIDSKVDCNAVFQDRFGNEYSCSHLALYCDFPRSVEHPLVKLIAAGAQFEQKLLRDLDNVTLERILKNHELVEALISRLKETNQDHPIQFQAALSLNDSNGSEVMKAHSARLSQVGIEELIDLFRSAVRLDRTHVMEELLRDKRLDVSFKEKSSEATFLHHAAKKHSIGAVQSLLSLGVNPNSVKNYKETPLHLAVRGEHNNRRKKCISLLLDHGADVNAVDYKGRTVWHEAVSCHNGTDIIRLLLGCRGNETQGLDIACKDGWTPLLRAAQKNNTQTCELLASHASYVHRICPDGLSLIHYAVKMNSMYILQKLQEKGIELTEKTRDEQTGLHFISSKTSLEVVRLLINSGVDTTSSSSKGETVLHKLAAMEPSPDAEIFDTLWDIFTTQESLNSSDIIGLTPLHYALRSLSSSSLKHAEALIARGADVHMRLANGTGYLGYLISEHTPSPIEKDPTNRTPLQVLFISVSELIINSTTNLELLAELVDVQKQGDMRIRLLNYFLYLLNASNLVGLLLEKGINVDLLNTGENSWSAVHTACYYGAPLEQFRKIFKMSACPFEFNKCGQHLTHITCLYGATTSITILEELCNSGFDLNLTTIDEFAFTPLMLAALHGKLEHFQMLVSRGANVRAKNSEGAEAAHFAAKEGRVAMIRQLIDFDIDWNLCISDIGYNILHFAILNNRYSLVEFIAQNSLLDILYYEGASRISPLGLAAELGQLRSFEILLKASSTDVNAFVAKNNVRSIHLAVASGNLDLVKELLKHNCTLAPDGFGMTPQLIALEHGYQDIFNIIEEYEARNRIADQDALSTTDQQSNTKVDAVASKSSEELKYAILNGNLKLCKGLIEAGFSINRPFHCGCTPLLYALAAGEVEIVRFFLQQKCSVEGIIPNNCHMSGSSVAHLVCSQPEMVDVLKLILDEHPSIMSLALQYPINPIHMAVSYKNSAGLIILLDHLRAQSLGNIKIDIPVANTTSSEGTISSQVQDDPEPSKPKILFANDPQIKTSEIEKFTGSQEFTFWKSGTLLHHAACDDNLDAANILLQYGTNVNSIGEDSETSLHVASNSGSISIARLLLESGANPRIRDVDGCIPVMKATFHGHLELVNLLFDQQKDPNTTDSFGFNLLHYAIGGGPRVFSFLLGKGCCPYSEDYQHRVPAILALWHHRVTEFAALILNLDLDYSRLKGAVAQTWGIWDDSDKFIVQRFLKRAPPNTIYQELIAITWRKGSILGDAAQDGVASIVKLFVESGANLELDQGSYGTPLLAACSFGRFPVVKYLIQAGAQISSMKRGKPCSAIEAASSFPEIVHWLLVEQYTEQPRLESSFYGTEEMEMNTWSGVHCVKMETMGLYVPNNEDSLFDRVQRLEELRRELRGQVVNVLETVEGDANV